MPIAIISGHTTEPGSQWRVSAGITTPRIATASPPSIVTRQIARMVSVMPSRSIFSVTARCAASQAIPMTAVARIGRYRVLMLRST
ncbi:Uncharacterised protein [Mycobacteroides abscessus subsp. abscessus]|nr:Uncharacterised protein [Mycobacteroides abscessus subsp. abscessus]